jgi:polyisoprenoid-binding protein YceI
MTLQGGRVAAKGTLTKLHGTVIYDALALSKSSVDAVIPISSLDTKIGVRDSELQGQKYFDCVRFPEARFQASQLATGTTTPFLLDGTLTLHGAKQTVRIKLDAAPKLVTQNGRTVLTAEGYTSIDQTAFGLDLLKLHPDGYMRINDLVGIKITLQANN